MRRSIASAAPGRNACVRREAGEACPAPGGGKLVAHSRRGEVAAATLLATTMSTQSADDGPVGRVPRQQPDPQFAPRDPILLPLLVPYSSSRGTRFAEFRHRPAPVDPARLAMLLEICGYDVRTTDVVEMLGAHGRWLPAPVVLSSSPMPLLALLQYVFDRDWPARPMDPNDERLEAVFADA